MKMFARLLSNDGIVLVLLCGLCYGLFVGMLGFYWEDWLVLWAGSKASPWTLSHEYGERPGTAWIFAGNLRLLGTHALSYQLDSMLVRLLGAFFVNGIVRVRWPRQRFAAFAAAALYLVYPGFSQQPIAVTYQNYHWAITLALGSILASLRSEYASRPSARWLWFLLAIGTQLAYLLILDYIIVLELLRLLLLRGDRESEGPRPRWIRAVLPYVLVALGFVAARIVLHNPGYRNNPATELGRWADPSRVLALGPSLVDSVLESAVFAWSYPAWLVVEEGSARLVGVALLVGGLAAALVGVRGWGARKPADSERGLRPFIVIGVATLVAVCLLMAVLHRCVALGNVMNRYAYPPAVGCCLFAIGVMSYLPRRLFVLAVAVLVGSASAANVRNANDYRVAWRRQRAIYWQLAWRAPEIRPETTVVLLSPLKEQHSHHTALTGALNLAYTAPRERPLLGLGHDDETQAWMESGDGAAFLAREPFWVWTLTPTAGPRDGFNDFLALYLDPVSSTLRVLDSKHLEELPARAGLAHSAARFSSQDRITGSGPRGIPTRQLFGPEPAHDWRWYFQRAELARQSGQFGEAAQLGREVLKRDFSTLEPSEWLVFIEAAIRSQDEATARAALRRGLASADRPSLRGFSRTLAKLALDLASPGRELALQLEAQVDEETSELDRLGTPGRLSESRNYEER